MIYTMGQGTGCSMVGKLDYVALMQANNKHGKGSKGTNYKETKKANIRREEKYDREVY